jgi:hypothetical protein
MLVCLSRGSGRCLAQFNADRLLSYSGERFNARLLNGCLQLRNIAAARTGFGKLRRHRQHDGCRSQKNYLGCLHRKTSDECADARSAHGAGQLQTNMVDG